MRLLELHILQSFPYSCLNRDAVGRPKMGIFGGEKRARIASQCLKRAIRLFAQKEAPQYFQGIRTKQLVEEISKRLAGEGKTPSEQDTLLAQAAAHCIAGLDFKKKDPMLVTTSMFFSDSQYDVLVKELNALPDESKKAAIDAAKALLALKAPKPGKGKRKEKQPKGDEPAAPDGAAAEPEQTSEQKKGDDAKEKNLNAAINDVLSKRLEMTLASKDVKDAVDIALFGRMVASHPELQTEGAALFAHALTTHRAEAELDFFSAVDDRRKPSDDAGADMIGDLEFISGTFYRYCSINLDLLFYQKDSKGNATGNLPFYADGNHLSDRKKIIEVFVRSCFQAVPSGRKNSMNGDAWPDYAIGIIRSGQPVQLVNAFESPVGADGGTGYLKPSWKTLNNYQQRMFERWGITLNKDTDVMLKFGDDSDCVGFPKFVEEITRHVT